MREITVLDACQHENVMLMVEYFETKKDLLIIFGRCYGDAEMVHLNEENGIAPQTVLKWTAQCAAGLAYCHSLEVCHRDIKLPNLLLNSLGPNSGIVIGDFGFAEHESHLASEEADICGTPLALAPEVLDGGFQNRTGDVWAMGITFYEMVAHEHPFSNDAVKKMVKTLQKQESHGGSKTPGPPKKPPGGPLKRTNTIQRTEERMDEYKEANAMYKSVTFKRKKKDERSNKTKSGHMQLQGERNKDKSNNASFLEQGSALRSADEFYKVATKFSTNAKFVEKFEELAVAVTSEAVELNFAHQRFKDEPKFVEIANALLTRDVKKRPTAAAIKAMIEGS
jgi:serine/threonine protein kinase